MRHGQTIERPSMDRSGPRWTVSNNDVTHYGTTDVGHKWNKCKSTETHSTDEELQ